MELMRRSLMTKRATLLASTAIIALLGACQSSGGGAGASSTAPATASSNDKMPMPDPGAAGY